MNTGELIDAVSERAVLTKADTKRMVEAIIGVITDELVAGNEVRINGFGTLRVHDRAARVARNPRTGEQMQVPAKRVPVMKLARALTEAMNPAARQSVRRRA